MRTPLLRAHGFTEGRFGRPIVGTKPQNPLDAFTINGVTKLVPASGGVMTSTGAWNVFTQEAQHWHSGNDRQAHWFAWGRYLHQPNLFGSQLQCCLWFDAKHF